MLTIEGNLLVRGHSGIERVEGFGRCNRFLSRFKDNFHPPKLSIFFLFSISTSLVPDQDKELRRIQAFTRLCLVKFVQTDFVQLNKLMKYIIDLS